MPNASGSRSALSGGLELAAERDDAARRGLGPDRRRDAAEDDRRRAPVPASRGRSASMYGPPPDSPITPKSSIPIRSASSLRSSLKSTSWPYRCAAGGPDAGPVDADQPDAELDRGDPRRLRDLPPGPGRAVQPEHRPAAGGSELREPQVPAVVQRHGALEAGRGQQLVRSWASLTRR